MAIEANLLTQRAPMLLGRLPVHLVACQTRRLRSIHNHVANIAIDVAVSGIETRIVRQRKLHLIILKEIVAGHELIR